MCSFHFIWDNCQRVEFLTSGRCARGDLPPCVRWCEGGFQAESPSAYGVPRGGGWRGVGWPPPNTSLCRFRGLLQLERFQGSLNISLSFALGSRQILSTDPATVSPLHPPPFWVHSVKWLLRRQYVSVARRRGRGSLAPLPGPLLRPCCLPPFCFFLSFQTVTCFFHFQVFLISICPPPRS